jgi:hypothetical protein
MKKIATAGLTLIVLISLSLNACGSTPAVPTATSVDVGAIRTAAVETAIAELTHNAPTVMLLPTLTLAPSITPSPTETLTPTIAPTNTPLQLSLEDNIAIYMINVIDQANCSYETLPIPINHGFTDDMETDVRLAVSYLIGTKWESSGYLTNPLSTSNLYFVNTEVNGTDLNINLSGVISRYDDPCQNEEASSQLRATIWTAIRRYDQPVINFIYLWVDDLLFDDVMLKG